MPVLLPLSARAAAAATLEIERDEHVARHEHERGLQADAAQQVRAVEDLIARKVDVIAVVPNDAVALEPVFKRAQEAGIKVLTHVKRRGKSAALFTGLRICVGDWVQLLDGDGQNDPADARRVWDLVAAKDENPALGIVCGRRTSRNDSGFKWLQSRVANGIRRFCLRDDLLLLRFTAGVTALTPLMILWINLVTNGLPALALGIDPPDAKLMSESPRKNDEGLLVRRDYLGILYVGAVMGLCAVALYALAPQEDEEALLRTRAVAFSLLALSPLFHAWSCRSPIRSLFSSRPLISLPLVVAVAASAAIHLVAILVPSLRPVFRTYGMSPHEWMVLLALAALIVPAVEAAKVVYRKLSPEEAAGPASVAPAPTAAK